MDRDAIERIRTATFPMARRGYEKRDVERFLDQVADWLETGAGDDSRSETVRAELERVGRHTAKILTEAYAAAEALKEEAQQELTRVRSEADAYSERVRIEADTYAREQREEADSYVERRGAAIELEIRELRRRADEETEELAAATAHRRAELEAEIAELEVRRHEAVERMRRLSSLLAGTATEHDTPLAGPGETGGYEDMADELAEAEVEAYDVSPSEVEAYDVSPSEVEPVEPPAETEVHDIEPPSDETMEFDVEREFVRRDEEGSGPG